MTSYISSISGLAGQAFQWVAIIFGALLTVAFAIGWFQYTHAGEDHDVLKAKKRLYRVALGAVGFYAIGAIVATLRTLHS